LAAESDQRPAGHGSEDAACGGQVTGREVKDPGGDFFDGRLNLAVPGPPGFGELDLLFKAGFQQLRCGQLGYCGQHG
jgi:hypothetical protein